MHGSLGGGKRGGQSRVARLIDGHLVGHRVSQVRNKAVIFERQGHVTQRLDCGYSVRFMSFFLPSRDVRRPNELSI